MDKWYSASQEGTVLASKITLSRNLAGVPFPSRLSEEGRKSVCKKIFAALQNSKYAGEFDMLEMTSVSSAEKLSMVQRGIISPDMAQSESYSCLLLSRDESISIMLCEKEHIKITVMGTGSCLTELYKLADKLDNVFIDSLKIAFDKRLGFLTANPALLGTGMTAALILKLPKLKSRGALGALTAMVKKLGFGMKPLFDTSSDFYELENSITLGITEQSAIDNLNAVCKQIVSKESMISD
ncbi:MAG: hypothetical protein J5964_06310 [Eubacterium sp.]|nr:hypothetical protein [Eubacterium sp.]